MDQFGWRVRRVPLHLGGRHPFEFVIDAVEQLAGGTRVAGPEAIQNSGQRGHFLFPSIAASASMRKPFFTPL